MYKLFLDLDGVLADFDAGVIELFGEPPSEIPPPRMWARIARTEGFYAELPWMPDGRQLWEFAAAFEPTILTGLPRGSWAEPQKRTWCARELGDEVPVITCMSREKADRGAEATPPGKIPVLIDDRERLRDAWVEAGGVFIHHTGADSSITAIRELLDEAR